MGPYLAHLLSVSLTVNPLSLLFVEILASISISYRARIEHIESLDSYISA
jgi:hypothetical protein